MKKPIDGAPVIRPATADDIPVLLELIAELAEYERLSHALTASADSLRESLFGSRPAAEALLAEAENRTVGYAVFFENFSSFTGRPGIYLEDVYVRPPARGRGIGRLMLTYIARIAVQRQCARLEWAVLDWNEPSIEFYNRLGARPMSDWTIYRLAGDDLLHVAAQQPPIQTPPFENRPT